MTTFLALAFALSAVAVGFAVWSLLRSTGGRDSDRASNDSDRASVNVALYRQRLAEIDRDVASGRLDAATREIMVAELGANLLDEAAATRAEPAPAPVASRGNRWTIALVCTVAIPLVATLLYRHLGAQEDWALADALTVLRTAPGEDDLEGLDRLVALLETREQKKPADPETLYLLGHARMRQGEYAAAADTFERMQPMRTRDLSVLVSLAQARYLAAEGRISPETRVSMDAALALNPHEPLVLEMLALDAIRSSNFAAAVEFLETALAGGLEGPRAASLQAGLAKAKAALAGRAQERALVAANGAPDAKATPVPAAERASDDPGADVAAPAKGARVHVTIALAPSAAAAPGARVFVIARQIGGPPMPIAVRALSPSDLPVELELSDADAMQPGRLLSQFDRVEVLARLSQSGTPTRQAGDLEASSGAVNPHEAPRLSLLLGG